MGPDKAPPCLWKEYAQFLKTPMMLFVLGVPVSFFVNDISNIMAQKKFGMIRGLPYMGSSAVVVVITMLWCFKRKEHRFGQQEPVVHPYSLGTQMTQTSQSFVLAVLDDTADATIGRRGPIPPVASWLASCGDASQDAGMTINNSRRTSESSNHQSAGGRDSEDIESETSERSTSDCPIEGSGGGSQPVMNGDFSSDDPSSGSSGFGASDQAPASLVSGEIERNSEAQLESPSPSMFTVASVEDIAILKEALMAELEHCQSGPFVVFVINNPRIARLVETIRPQANMPGSRVLHKRIEIGPQSGNWFEDFLYSEIMEPMRMAKMFDKDCTMQLGSVAIFKHTDAGLKCWMLQKDWTPVIVDVYRCPQTLLDLLAGAFPKWRVRGFNLENTTLKLGITETERSTDLTILHHNKIGNGGDELWFEEPSSFAMFSKKVYISASNSVEVEAGVTFKLHSEARKVQQAFRISVLDGLINSPWAQIILASWLFLLGNFVISERQDFFSACWLLTVLSIGISTYFLRVHRAVPLLGSTPAPSSNLAREQEPEEVQNLEIVNQAPTLSDEPNLILEATGADSGQFQIFSEGGEEDLASLVRSLSRDDNENLQIQAAEVLRVLARQSESNKLRILDQDGALANLVSSLSESNNPHLQARAAEVLWSLAAGKDEAKLKILEEDGALVSLIWSLSQGDNPELQTFAAAALRNLAAGTEEIKLKILEEEGALAGLVRSLSEIDNPELQAYAAGALQNLACGTKEVKLKISNEDGALVGLTRCLAHYNNPKLQANAARALQSLALGGEKILQKLKDNTVLAGVMRPSEFAANTYIKKLPPSQGVTGQNTIHQVQDQCVFPSRDDVPEEANVGMKVHALSMRMVSKSRYKGALAVLSVINYGGHYLQGFLLQEKGIIKRMMGDLVGALEDLTAALEIFSWIENGDSQIYDSWKHRGYVNFLLGDIQSAERDGKMALKMQLEYRKKWILPNLRSSLGQESVEYMHFKLEGWEDMIQHEQLMLSLHSQVMQMVGMSEFLGALALFATINTRVLPYQSRAFFLKERGILKRIAGDLNGAQEDLTMALEMVGDDYECRKHRGYVKYLVGDVEGARRDAERCLMLRDNNAPKDPKYLEATAKQEPKCLGAYPLKFLEFNLE